MIPRGRLRTGAEDRTPDRRSLWWRAWYYAYLPLHKVARTLGLELGSDLVPADDDSSVALRREACAVLVSKLATPELAFGDARVGHRAQDPWISEHWCGGSSSGPAVALASGVVPLSRGTDAGGSFRVPSSYCGVSGL